MGRRRMIGQLDFLDVAHNSSWSGPICITRIDQLQLIADRVIAINDYISCKGLLSGKNLRIATCYSVYARCGNKDRICRSNLSPLEERTRIARRR